MVIPLNAVTCRSGGFLWADTDQYVEQSLLSNFQDTCELLLLAFQCGNYSIAQSKVVQVETNEPFKDKQKQHVKGQFQQRAGLLVSSIVCYWR